VTLAPRPGDQYGAAVFEKVMGMARDLVLGLKGHEVRDEDIICINDRGGDAFLVFLPPVLASSAAATS
jgi:hypothetical protein